ncbi:MAG TPA: hypothetical protein DCS93_28870 [Microscillaceae bacterium]|nr:hypothetical protein [Microscillaceae bacterium]
MKNLYIDYNTGGFLTPSISLNASKGECDIRGESSTYNAKEFYRPVLNWVRAYIQEINQPLHFRFCLTYLDTPSTEIIITLLNLLKTYENNGGQIKITWYYAREFVGIAEPMEDFIGSLNLTIQFVPFVLI